MPDLFNRASERNLGFFTLARSVQPAFATNCELPDGISKGLSRRTISKRRRGEWGDVSRFGPRLLSLSLSLSSGPFSPQERTERKNERKGKELGIQKYYGRGRFLVSKFRSLCALEKEKQRREKRETKHARRDWTQRGRKGRGVAETVKRNELAARRNSDIRSLFPYFNYLVIPAIYIMYFGHRIGGVDSASESFQSAQLPRGYRGVG